MKTYMEPRLEYYGTFRELTQVGETAPSDNVTVDGAPSVGGEDDCITLPNGDLRCFSA